MHVPVLMFGPWVLNEIWVIYLSSTLVAMLMSFIQIILFLSKAHINLGARPLL